MNRARINGCAALLAAVLLAVLPAGCFLDADRGDDPSPGASGGGAGGDDGNDGGGGGGGGGGGDGATLQPLPESAFVYVKHVGLFEQIWAYDTATNETWLITDLDGHTELLGRIGLSPDRTLVAFAAEFRLGPDDRSEIVYTVTVDGKTFKRLTPPNHGISSGYVKAQDVTFTPDGAHVLYERYHESGGQSITRPLRVRVDGSGSPQVLGGASPCRWLQSPVQSNTGQWVGVLRGWCTSSAEPFAQPYLYHPSFEQGQPVFPGLDDGYSSSRPVFWPNDKYVLGTLRAWFDTDHDGTYETEGTGIIVRETDTQDVWALLPPLTASGEYGGPVSLALAPTPTTLVFCSDIGNVRNLYSIDPTSPDPRATLRQLTTDGASCHPAWRY